MERVVNIRKIPVNGEENGELLGFAVQDSTGWQAQTFFGYTIERASDERHARAILQEKGLSFLTGMWQYYDKDDGNWHPCIIKEAYEHQVIVVRTNVLGYQDPNDYKRVAIESPSETNLVKSE